MIKSFVTGQLSLLLSAGREMNTGQSGDALPLEDGSFHPYVSLDKRAGGTWNCDLSLTRDNLDASGIIDRAYYKALGLYKSPVYFTLLTFWHALTVIYMHVLYAFKIVWKQ